MTLLNTIKLPKNLKLLTDRLPKSKYEEDCQTETKSMLGDVASTKSLKTNSDAKDYVIRTGGRKAQKKGIPDGAPGPNGKNPRRSAMSEERK